MKYNLLAPLLIFISVLTSCDREHEEGLWYYCSDRVDLSQENKYDPSLFLNDWVLTKVSTELYRDGELIISGEDSDFTPMELSFTGNRTVTCGDMKDVYWEYRYNHIHTEAVGTPSEREVINLDQNTLVVKYEGNHGKPAFFKDPSGYHSFVIWEFQAKE